MDEEGGCGQWPTRSDAAPTDNSADGTLANHRVELWELDDLDLLGPAQIAIERGGRRRMNFIAVDLLLDYQLARRDNRDGVEFTFDGSDEGDRVSGCALAQRAGLLDREASPTRRRGAAKRPGDADAR